MDILAQIIDAKRRRLDVSEQEVSLAGLRQQAMSARSSARPHAFLQCLSRDSINVIAEFKRRSPSRGLIRADVAAKEMARVYEAGGAVAISVLTEEDYFGGSLADLQEIKETVSLPVLRKDFIIDESQIYEAAKAGADAVLLIVAALKDDVLQRLRGLAEDELGMDALVEVHTEYELERATRFGAKLIGVNNRDLKTFEVSLETSISLAALASDDLVLVSESGLQSHAELLQLRAAGFDGFLIGETLMREKNPDGALRALVAGK